jgi:hypothetical protein
MAESGFLVASRRGRANLLDEVHIWRHACIRDSNGRRSGTRLGDREYRGEGQPIGPAQSVHSGNALLEKPYLASSLPFAGSCLLA